MDLTAIVHLVLIHLPTAALGYTLFVLLRAVHRLSKQRPERTSLLTADDAVADYQRRTRQWENRRNLLHQLATVNTISFAACLVTLLFAYAFPPLWVAAFTVAYLLLITPYLLKKIPAVLPALQAQFGR